MPHADDAAAPPAAEAPPGMPRWVKIGAVVLGILILLFLLLHVTGVVSGHGPGQHLSESAGRSLPGPLPAGASSRVA